MAPTRKPEAAPRCSSERLQLAKVIEGSKGDTTRVSKSKRLRRPKQRKSCHLFRLPGELRNEIYAYALTSTEPIEVAAKGPGQPSLLRVCKGVRNEASKIYYGENQFRLKVLDFNGAELTPFCRQYRRYDTQHDKTDVSNVSFLLRGDPSFTNLIRWCEELYWDRSMRPEFDKPVTNSDYVCDAAFKMVDALDSGLLFYGWPAVKEALQALQNGLKRSCSRWARS
ncbi:hypothetical protein LTR53_005128 [Teratosphaeriaceae sp. CCFEE 6253]|nr:hypothetical protein LTR53_005128 [Teratosphaeriaceae sp. CCFEE 6253]